MKVAPGVGVIDVTAPEGAVVLVDGTERAKGSTSLQLAAGHHDVRIKKTPASPASPGSPASSDRGCDIDVHASRVAHVKF